MSVQALSPYAGSKRLFEEKPEDVESPCDRGQGKRGRFLAGSPSGRCSTSPAGAVHPATLEALKGLFLGMDDQAVTAVLVECGNDIDAAIRCLNLLRIEAGEAAAVAITQQQQNQQQQQEHALARQQQQPQRRQQQQQAGSAPAAAPGEQQRTQQQQQQQQQVQQQQLQEQQAARAGAAPVAARDSQAGPQTAEQWVDTLVSEMACATDIPDARARAAKLLQAFEQFVGARIGAQGGGNGSVAAGGGAPHAAALQARLEEAQRENAILKRAVQIQNARMQEAAVREGEVAGLKQLVAQYQERLRHLELSNYSLALHLQKATGDAPIAPGQRPPDVY